MVSEYMRVKDGALYAKTGDVMKKKLIGWGLALGLLIVAAIFISTLLPKDDTQPPTQYGLPENGLVAYVLSVQCGYDGDLRRWIDMVETQSAYDLAMDLGYGESRESWEEGIATLAAGEAAAISAADFSEVGELILTLTDGTRVNLGSARSDAEKQVSKAEKDDRGHLMVTYADGLSVDLGAIVALSGNAVEAVEAEICIVSVDPEGKLQVTLTGGTTMDLGSIG